MTVRIIIAGGRDFDDIEKAEQEINLYVNSICCEFDEVIVISGACSDKKGALTFTREDGTKVYGADGLGERVALWNGWTVEPCPADWEKHGRSAGPIRNRFMAREKKATHAMVFWDGQSRGSKNMIEEAEAANIQVKKIMYERL